MNKKKLIISAIALIVLGVGLVAGLVLVRQRQELRRKAAPASTLSILPAAKTASVGESFSLTATIDTATNVVTAAELYIEFDSAKLTLEEVVPGTFLPVVLVQPSIGAGSASLTLGAQPTNPPQGSGVLATLKFKAKAAGSGNVGFGASSQAAGIDETTNIIVGMNPASVTIVGAAAPVPSPSPSPLPSPPAEAKKPTVSLPAGNKVKIGEKITGKAAPNSTVTIVIKSHTITATVTADAQGNWSYTLPSDLEPGSHTITVTDSNGTTTLSFTAESTSTSTSTSAGDTSASTGTTSTGSGTGGASTTTTTKASATPSPSLQNVSAEDLPVTATSWPTVVGVLGGVVLLIIGLALAL